MPRFNVQHPETKKWRCFSTIVDNWITDWMDEYDYEKWRFSQYGYSGGSVKDRDVMKISLAEAETLISQREEGLS